MNLPVEDKLLLNVPWKILIIDDDEEDYLLTKGMLKEARGRKFVAEWAAAFEAGRSALFSNHYDAVLVDYDLGVHSGIELIREANERGYPSPLILLTGRGNYEVDVEAMQAGATMYLTKREVNPLLLERSIRYAVERKLIEETLRHSEEKFAKAFQYNPAAMTITRAADARYIDANETFCRLVGYDCEELIGHTSVELGLYSEETRQAVLREYRELGSVRQQEFPVLSKNGKLSLVMFSLDPIEVSGEPCNLATMIDITEKRQAEEQIRYQASLLAEAQDAIVATDRTWRITYWNKMAEEVFGWSEVEAMGRIAPELLQSHFSNATREQVVQQLVESGRYVGEVIYQRKDGKSFIALARTAVLRGSNNEIIGYHSSVQDISERKQAEQVLRKALNEAAWMARFPDENPNPVARISAEGVVMYRNTPAGELSGWECEVGQPLGGPLRELVDRAMARTEEAQEDVPLADCIYAISVMPFLEERYVNVYGRDVTQRKQADDALLERERQYRELAETLEVERNKLAAIINTLPVGVGTGDTQGNTLSLNSAGLKLHGFQSEEEMFSRLDQFIQDFTLYYLDGRVMPVEDWPAYRAMRGEYVQEYELRLRNNRNAGERIVSYSVSPVRNSQGEIAIFVYVIQDITERKQAAQALAKSAMKLERSNRDLEQFAFVASHDLNEPLRKIRMFGDRLSDHLSDNYSADAKDYIQRMQSAAMRMQTMIDGLLDLSRVNARGDTFAPVQLKQVVENVLSDLEARIQSTGGQVIFDDLPTIEADELQIHRLFQNLIGNALKFHKPSIPPKIRITGEMDQSSTVTIRIEDNGIGFNQEYAERIFQPFQRLQGVSEYEGTGLGLAICQKIVERHHGKIEAHSQRGEGSMFIIQFPATQTF